MAAKAGFWNLPRSFIAQAMAHEHVERPAGGELFDDLFALVQAVLTEPTDQQVLDCLAQRFEFLDQSMHSSSLGNLLELEESTWCFDRGDHRDLKKECSQDKANRDAHLDFCTRYKNKRAEICMEPARKRLKEHARKTSARKMPVDCSGLPQSTAKKFLPPGAYIWKSNGDAGWSGHFAPFARAHYSGTLYGSHKAFLFQLADLWAKYLQFHGLSADGCPYPEVREVWSGELKWGPVGVQTPAATHRAPSSVGGAGASASSGAA